MKKISYLFFLILAAAVAVTGCSKGYERQTTAGDLKVTLSVERYPLVKGDNVLAVKIADASGQPATDAVVNVRYYMPPMPGMAPMDFSTQAVLKGDKYVLTANIPMEGGWKAEVSAARPGQQASSATFNLDAR